MNDDLGKNRASDIMTDTATGRLSTAASPRVAASPALQKIAETRGECDRADVMKPNGAAPDTVLASVSAAYVACCFARYFIGTLDFANRESVRFSPFLRNLHQPINAAAAIATPQSQQLRSPIVSSDCWPDQQTASRGPPTVKTVGRQALPDVVEFVRRRFQHKCLRELGYVLGKIFCRSRNNWLLQSNAPLLVQRHKRQETVSP
jgi:hypothetical protein